MISVTLIKTKLATGRAQDLADVEKLLLYKKKLTKRINKKKV